MPDAPRRPRCDLILDLIEKKTIADRATAKSGGTHEPMRRYLGVYFEVTEV